MLGAVGKQNMVIFCGGLCFLKFVQVLPSGAEREWERAGSCLQSIPGAGGHPALSNAWPGSVHLVRRAAKRQVQICKPKVLLPGSSSLWWGEEVLKAGLLWRAWKHTAQAAG